MPTLTPTSLPAAINPSDACQVASARNVGINVRSGPGTNYGIVGSLLPTETGVVLGRLADGSWYRISVNGVLGWVAASVVTTGGDCGGISIVAAPTAVPQAPAPTNTQATERPANSSNGSDNNTGGDNSGGNNNPGGDDNGGGSNGGGGSPGGVRQPPGLNFTGAPQTVLQPLNFAASPIYGIASLTPSFTPDPYTVNMTTGGTVDVSYLGLGFCSGFASIAPDLRIDITGSDRTEQGTLWFNFVTDNTYRTIVIRSPGGHYQCSTLAGALGLHGTIPGTWYVWIASTIANASVRGTLEISRHDAG